MLKHYPTQKLIAGCDEAGRGCLAGPVVSAAVILPKNFKNNSLKDSKITSEKNRNILYPLIKKESICWAIGIATVEEIDKINVLNATFLSMHRAINKLTIKPEFLIIDGNRFNNHTEIQHKCIVKGDGKFVSIAAASILAKTYRDNLMKEIDLKYPHYNWKKNKGYPTNQHRNSINKFGINIHHRRSFKLVDNQLNLSL